MVCRERRYWLGVAVSRSWDGAVRSVCSTLCEIWIMAWRDRELWGNWETNCFSLRWGVENYCLHIQPSPDAGAVTIASSNSNIYMVIGWRSYPGVKAHWFNVLRFPQRWQIGLHSGLTARYAPFRLRRQWSSPNMNTLWSRSALQPLWYSWDNLDNLHKFSTWFLWGTGVLSAVCGWPTADTLNSHVPDFLSCELKWSHVSSCPGCVNSSKFIFVGRKHTMPCWTILVIVPFTRLGSASSLSLHCSVSSSSSSSPSSPSSELARSLRQSLIAPSISSHVVSGSLDVNPAIYACVLSSCSCWNTASASSTPFLAPAVSVSI